MIRRVLAWAAGVFALSCLALSGYVLYLLVFGVPLRVAVQHGTVCVDTQTLGEYGTGLSRIRVSDAATHAIVWEATSVERDGLTSVWTFLLVPGKNAVPARIAPGFHTVVPEHEAGFVLQPGRSYRVDVWGTSVLHHNSRTFVTPAKGTAS